ncbi:MAG: ProQ/FINO family protein [Aquincola sp.]|nr:ProQ/FINO family protein [Aquincola sp.]
MTSTDDSVPQEAPAPAAAAPAPVLDAPALDAPAVDAPTAATDAAPAVDEAAAHGEVTEAGTAAPADAVASPPTLAADHSPAATGARLAELFPALFVGPDGQGTWRAIKLRIHADIQARAPGQFSKRTLGIFFSRYTTTTPYLKALAAPGAQRFDLDGEPAGEIAEEHRAAAVEELERRRAIAAERRATRRPQRAPAPVRRDEAALQPDAAHAAPKGPTRRTHIDTPGSDARTARPPRAARERGEARRGGTEARGASSPSPHAPAARRPSRPHDERLAAPPSPPERAPSAALPTDPAQRERALLLRAYEGSTLSKANFCALKRLTEAELDAALMQARAERR